MCASPPKEESKGNGYLIAGSAAYRLPWGANPPTWQYETQDEGIAGDTSDDPYEHRCTID
jgi:hypothetical protein